MGDPIGRYVQAVEAALAGVDNTPLDQLLIANMVRTYGEMVRESETKTDGLLDLGGDPWTVETAVATIIEDLVESPAKAPQPFEFAFAKKLASNRVLLAQAIRAKADARPGPRAKNATGPTADEALMALLKALAMAIGDASALRVAAKRVRAARSEIALRLRDTLTQASNGVPVVEPMTPRNTQQPAPLPNAPAPTPLVISDRTSPELLDMPGRVFRRWVAAAGVPHVTIARRCVARTEHVLAALDRLSGAEPRPTWSEDAASVGLRGAR